MVGGALSSIALVWNPYRSEVILVHIEVSFVCDSVNVFIPLVDITRENGPTDFFPYVLLC